MKQSVWTQLVKFLILSIAAAILTLSAFGIGVSVGATQTRPDQPASAEALCPPTATPAPQTGEAPALPSATPTTRVQTKTGPGAGPLDIALFNEAWQLLEQQFYGELPQGEDITYAALRGVISVLDDPHTAFLNPKQAERARSDMEGNFEGIGARVSQAEGGGVEIKYLFPDQPAQKAGVRVGDVIVAVDDKDVTKMLLDDAISLIRGPKGTQVVLTIRRGDEPLQKITVVRARIEIPVVESKTLADGKIAYIALGEFSSIAPQRLAEALQAALDQKPAGLILDLRGNPGGLLDAAVRIGSYFVPEGNILIERFKDQPEKTYSRTGRYRLGNTPLVVLVDGGSASASEIVAGAIQDAGTGVLIGEQTFGKGSVQLPNTLSDGSQLRVTIARWFTPKDRGIHGVGLTPDIQVASPTPEDIAAGRDPQLDRAVEYLLTGK